MEKAFSNANAALCKLLCYLTIDRVGAATHADAGLQSADVCRGGPGTLRGQIRVLYVRFLASAPLYVGPYKVLARKAKFLKLEIGGRQWTVIVDCLKSNLSLNLAQAIYIFGSWMSSCKKPAIPFRFCDRLIDAFM
jgi:hypothetical protein